VQLTYAADALRLEITDDGRNPPGTHPGHGLAGMRERASLYGGRLEAGPLDGGGYRVVAVLPRGNAA
jgi:signal transduction histidine kinase